jgi:hypothetical protein
MRPAFISSRDSASVGARAAVLAQEHDVYVGCAPRGRRFGGADAVERVWCLWADLDSPDAMGRLDAFEPAPSFVVASGSPGCVHAWWPLNRPLRPDHARVALRRLAHHLDGDMVSAEPARVLRPPGTRNHKHAPPAPVECVRLELNSYTRATSSGRCPTRPSAGRRSPRRRARSTRTTRWARWPRASTSPA